MQQQFLLAWMKDSPVLIILFEWILRYMKWLNLQIKFTIVLLMIVAWVPRVFAQEKLSDLIKKIEPAVVGIGLYTPIESKTPRLLGTGFIVGDGSLIVSNYHVVEKDLQTDIVQLYVAMIGSGEQYQIEKLTEGACTIKLCSL